MALAVRFIVGYIVGIAFTAWGVMLAAGSARLNWWSEMPAMGYGEAFNIVLAASWPAMIIGAVFWAIIGLLVSRR